MQHFKFLNIYRAFSGLSACIFSTICTHCCAPQSQLQMAHTKARKLNKIAML